MNSYKLLVVSTFTGKNDFSAAISAQVFLGNKYSLRSQAETSKVEGEGGKLCEGKVESWSAHQTSGPLLTGVWSDLTSSNSSFTVPSFTALYGTFPLTFQSL